MPQVGLGQDGVGQLSRPWRTQFLAITLKVLDEACPDCIFKGSSLIKNKTGVPSHVLSQQSTNNLPGDKSSMSDSERELTESENSLSGNTSNVRRLMTSNHFCEDETFPELH